jgi:SAM-dependent methyltransferase
MAPTSTNSLQPLLPRERFVPERLRAFACIDEGIEVFPAIDAAPAFSSLPWSWPRSFSSGDTVLDVGCTTGYSTAVLARLGREVVGVEPEPFGALKGLLRQSHTGPVFLLESHVNDNWWVSYPDDGALSFDRSRESGDFGTAGEHRV